jgi:hypothetical protein
MNTDQAVDEFLEHHGVRGQKWGVRKLRRTQNFQQVGAGKGTTSQKFRAGYNTGPIDLVKGRGFRGGAARKGARQANANQLVNSGHRTTRATLTRLAGMRYQDVIPTNKAATNTTAAVGASLAGVILVKAGTTAVKKLAKK